MAGIEVFATNRLSVPKMLIVLGRWGKRRHHTCAAG